MIGFLANIFSRYGNPECVVTFFKDRNIRWIKVSVYHPAFIGAVERFNRVLMSCVQAAIIQAAPWKETMTAFLQIYRPTPDSMTNVSPFELMFGRKMRTKLAVMPLPDCEHSDAEVHQQVSNRQTQIKTYCDKKRGGRAPALKVGDKVRVKEKTDVPKGHPRFTKPVEIQKQVGPCTYRLSDGKLWHSSHLTRVPDAAMIPADQRTQATDAAVMPTEQPLAGTSEPCTPE